jgi:hypothetical protein
MSEHERKGHIRQTKNLVTEVSPTIVTRTDTVKDVPQLAPEQKDRLSQALQELSDEIDVTVEDQIKILQETQKLVADDIENSPKVGFRADINGVAAKREFLGQLEETLQELQIQSLRDTEKKIKEASQQMSKLDTFGFTSQRSKAEALQTYVEELVERLQVVQGSFGS